jgi:hypothetical protein
LPTLLGMVGGGFVKDLVDGAAKVAPIQKITRDDINNTSEVALCLLLP